MDTILEMHGRLFDVKCTSCDHNVMDLSNPLCPALDISHIEDYNDAGTKQIDIPLKDLPRCAACRALARPGVVWFDEMPYRLPEIDRLVDKADMCLVVGTSSTVGSPYDKPCTYDDRNLLQVLPACLFAARVKSHGGKVAVFNLARSAADKGADFVFRGSCETELARVFPELV